MKISLMYGMAWYICIPTYPKQSPMADIQQMDASMDW